MIAADQVIQLKPNFKPFSRTENFNSHSLQNAVDLFNKAKQQLNTAKFPDLCYRAFQAFVYIDAYPILLELIRAATATLPPKESPAQLNSLNNLLDAHVYAKCNSYSEASGSLIKFLNASNLYTTISFEHFKEIVEKAFILAWFSYQIYQSLDGTVKISERSAHIIDQQINLTAKVL